MIGTNTHREVNSKTLALGFLVMMLMAACLLLGAAAHSAQAATTFFVNTTNDKVDESPGDGECYTGVPIIRDGGFIELECTLRAAIQEADALAGADVIHFGIPSTEDAGCDATTGVCTITPSSPLPTILRPLIINGYSQPGASANTATTGTNAALKIVLDGSNAGGERAKGLEIRTNNAVVRGLAINHFSDVGVLISGASRNGQAFEPTGVKIEGNFIGTDASGTTASDRKPLSGVAMDDGEDNVIGGATLAARNLISGNRDFGVVLSADGTGNRVQGNLIGTTRDGTSALGNDIGVYIRRGTDYTIGGNGAARNTIAFNGRHGVQVQGLFPPILGLDNRILSNSIYNNGALGIDLRGDGVTANDPQDPDTGPNTLQNFPGISTAVTSPTGSTSSTTIRGGLDSTPNSTFTIQFFSSPGAQADPSGFGEGKTFIGQRSVTTNAFGKASFEFIPAQSVPIGWRVTATATGAGGTSEFSRSRMVVRGS
jgi:CSLREA domain-containing protein